MEGTRPHDPSRDPRDVRDPRNVEPRGPRDPRDPIDPHARAEQTGFRFGWAAVLAGIVVAVALQIVFSLLGMAVGLSWWEPGSAEALGIASGVWTIVSWMAALFLGALVAGRLAGVLTPGDGALHGFVIWAGTTVIAAFFLLSGVSFLAGTTFDVLGQTVASTTSAAVSGATDVAAAGAGQADEIDYSELQGGVEDALREAGVDVDTMDAGEAVTEDPDEVPTDSLVQLVMGTIEQAGGEVDRESVAEVLAANTDLSEEEASNLAERVQGLAASLQQEVGSAYDTVVTRARQAAPEAAEGVGTAAWWTLLTLALAGGAAIGGGMITARS